MLFAFYDFQIEILNFWRRKMESRRITEASLPELGMLAATRAFAGAGAALLLGDRLSPDQRKAVGWTLFLIGALSTIPLGMEIFGGHRISIKKSAT
jgi:hypothetical protein